MATFWTNRKIGFDIGIVKNRFTTGALNPQSFWY
jgi:hypothetical protein